MSYGRDRTRLLVFFKCGPLHPAQILILPLSSLTKNGSDVEVCEWCELSWAPFPYEEDKDDTPDDDPNGDESKWFVISCNGCAPGELYNPGGLYGTYGGG